MIESTILQYVLKHQINAMYTFKCKTFLVVGFFMKNYEAKNTITQELHRNNCACRFIGKFAMIKYQLLSNVTSINEKSRSTS